MNILDWIILIWLGLSFWTGLRFGLIYRLGKLIGIVLGIYLAGQYYDTIAGWFGDSPWSKLIAFQAILSGISILSGYAAHLANKVFQFVSWIPFLKTANRLLGGVFGLATTVMILSIAVYFMSKIDISPILTQTLAESTLVTLVLPVGEALALLLPKDITQLQQLF